MGVLNDRVNIMVGDKCVFDNTSEIMEIPFNATESKWDNIRNCVIMYGDDEFKPVLAQEDVEKSHNIYINMENNVDNINLIIDCLHHQKEILEESK